MTRPTHRVRRGRVVEIPEEWRGKVPDKRTKRHRQSRLTRKTRNAVKWGRHGSHSPRARSEARAPRVEDWDG